MGNRSDPENGAIGAHHAADNSCDGAICVARGQRPFLDERSDRLCEVPVTLLVNQPRLNDGVTRLRLSIVTAEYNVPF